MIPPINPHANSVPERIREPDMREPLPGLVDRVPRRTAAELKTDLRSLAIEAAEAYDTGQYSLAERTLVRLAYTIASHYRDTEARNILAALRFIHRPETSIRLGQATGEAV